MPKRPTIVSLAAAVLIISATFSNRVSASTSSSRAVSFQSISVNERGNEQTKTGKRKQQSSQLQGRPPCADGPSRSKREVASDAVETRHEAEARHDNQNLALVFGEDRRVSLVRCEHFGTSISRDDGVSGVKAEVNKEEYHPRSDSTTQLVSLVLRFRDSG